MVVLEIIGIALAVILGLIILTMLLRLKFVIEFSEEKKLRFRMKILCFSFGGKNKKKNKKPSRLAQRLKKKFGLDVFDSEEFKRDVEQGILSDKVSRIVTLVMLFAGQIKWLFSKLRLDKLALLIICGGGDAADAAMEYGLICASVYPMAGYLTANINAKKDAEDIRIGCDFDGEARLEFKLIISIRIYNLLIAVLRALSDLATAAEKTEVYDER